MIEDLQRKLAEQAAEISNLKADVRVWPSQFFFFFFLFHLTFFFLKNDATFFPLKAHETLRQEHETLKQEHETLTQEHDDLLVLLSEQDYKMKTLKSRSEISLLFFFLSPWCSTTKNNLSFFHSSLSIA